VRVRDLFSVRVCPWVAPVGWVTPTAHTSFAALLVVTLVRLSPVPGEGLGLRRDPRPARLPA
jgi:hypothetical protein